MYSATVGTIENPAPQILVDHPEAGNYLCPAIPPRSRDKV